MSIRNKQRGKYTMNMKMDKSKIQSIIYMAANMLSFTLAFLINVILTKYSANVEVYGSYKYATNFVLTLPALFSMGVTWSCASLIASDKSENKNGIITVSVVYTVLLGATVVFGLCISYFFLDFFGNVVIIFPFVIFFFLQKLVNQIYMGNGQTVVLSLYAVAPNVIVFIGLIVRILFYDEIDYNFSILLYLISYTVVVFPKLFSIKYDISQFQKSSMQLFNDVKESGFKVHLSQVFTTSATQVIALFCGSIYGYEEYGYYSLAASLALIFQLIGNSLATINFKKYANSDKIEKHDFGFMAFLGGGAYVCMFILIDTVFFWFYPKSYEPTIYYLKVLCISNLVYGFSGMFNRFFIGKGLGSIVMKISVITSICSVFITVPMVYIMKMNGLTWSAVIVSFICILQYYFSYKKYQKRKGGKSNDKNFS